MGRWPGCQKKHKGDFFTKKFLAPIVVVFLLLCLTGIANATIIFEDNFDSENNGTYSLNYDGFDNWDVDNGTVDLIGLGSPWDWFSAAQGLYIDLDGSSGDAGRMLSTDKLTLLAGSYKLSFELAGNQRNPAKEKTKVKITAGIFSQTYSLTKTDPFTLYEEIFTLTETTNFKLKFAGVGGDNIGMLLDNVKLETAPVPEPATMLLFGLGLLGLAGVSRKKK